MRWIAQDIRLLVAASGGGLVALALFLLMHALISTGHQPVIVEQAPVAVGTVRIKRAVKAPPPVHKLPHRPRRMAHTPPTEGPSATPRAPVNRLPVPIPLRLGGVGPAAGPVFAPGTDVIGGAGGAPLSPLWRVRPAYPPTAAFHNVQGVVTTCFTVRADGSVADPRVAGGSSPAARRFLGAAAVAAVLHWKFAPRKVDGQPVATPNVCQDVHFKLQ